MSWVIESAVAPRSRTHSTISSLMTSAMIGSRPVVGSSKKMISGSAAMARARPTRFCMPPESSAGHSSATSAPGRPGPACERHAPWPRRAPSAPCDQAEGDVLPHRQAVEERRALEQHAELAQHALAARAAQLDHLLAVDLDGAAVGLHQPEDAFQRHRLAGAGAADDHHRIRHGDLEVDAIQHALRAEAPC